MKPSAYLAARLLSQSGVRHVVSSPGSRNYPLLEALCSTPELQITDIADERSAAFVALGLARQSRTPVALACTSGTALLNYGPAAAEALHQGIPLIILSADRPMQWIDQDDSQTIHQHGALRNIVKADFDIPDPDPSDQELYWYAQRTINQAIITATNPKPGPVHINLQFNAPLNTPSYLLPQPRHVELMPVVDEIHPANVHALLHRMVGKKVLVVAGYMPSSDVLTREITEFCERENVALLPEACANLHIEDHGGIDRVLTGIDTDTRRELTPDIVISLGGALVSRKVKEWLRAAPSTMEHWCIDRSNGLADCFQHLTIKLPVRAEEFFSSVNYMLRQAGDLISHTGYRRIWLHLQRRTRQETDSYPTVAEWCDFTAHRFIFSLMPPRVNVFLSNGTSIRYAELFARPSQHQLLCNRGTSGIEGCTSTAVGAALAYNGPTLLISGDMSARHDLAGLALPCVPDRFKAIIFNNGGGDIFRIIPSTRTSPWLEDHFTLTDDCRTSLGALAETFQYEYFYADSMPSLAGAYSRFLSDTRKSILEVDTRHINNAAMLNSYLSRTIKH